MPYLTIGGSRETFWKLNPKSIQIDFQAYKERQENELRMAWVQGLYVKLAIQSSVVACTLADKTVLSHLPKYPEMPKTDEQLQDEDNIKAQQELLIAKMNKWARMNNKK